MRSPSFVVVSETATSAIPGWMRCHRASVRLWPGCAVERITGLLGSRIATSRNGRSRLWNSSSASNTEPGARFRATVAAASASDPRAAIRCSGSPVHLAKAVRARCAAPSHVSHSKVPSSQSSTVFRNALATGAALGGAPGVSSHAHLSSAGNAARNRSSVIVAPRQLPRVQQAAQAQQARLPRTLSGPGNRLSDTTG